MQASHLHHPPPQALLPLLMSTTSHYNPDRGQAQTEGIIMHSADVLRWLFYKETGEDLGIQAQLPSRRKELTERYLTRLWGSGGDLQAKLSKFSDDEQMKLRTRLTKIFVWAKPFLDYNSAHGLKPKR